MFFKRWGEQEEFNNKVDQRLDKFDHSLQSSFGNVKTDVEHVKQWITYLHHNQDRMNASQSEMATSIKGINQQLTNILTKSELKAFVDEYYRLNSILKQGFESSLKESISTVRSEVDTRLASVHSTQNAIFERLNALSKRDQTADLREEVTTLRRQVSATLHDEVDVAVKSQVKTAVQEALNNTPIRSPISAQNSEISGEIQPESEQNMAQIPAQIQAQFPTQIQPTQAVFEKLETLNRRIDEVQSGLSKVQPVDARARLKEKIFRKVTRHSKDYVKSMLISLVKKHGKISGLALREIVVEEQGIVSKSSFYRLLAEIEEEDSVHVLHEGKEKHYFWTINGTPETR